MRDVYNLSADNALKFQANIIKAKQDGRKIQIKQMFEEEWQDLADSVVVFNFSNYDYRIKPKPRQRPYKSFTEFKDDLVRMFSKLLANWREINRHPPSRPFRPMKRRIKQTQPHGHMCGECSHGEPWTGPEGDPWNTRPDGQAITLHCHQDKTTQGGASFGKTQPANSLRRNEHRTFRY